MGSVSRGDFSPDGKDCNLCDQRRRHNHRLPLQHRQRKIDAGADDAGLTVPAGNPKRFSPDGKSLLLPHQDTQRPSDFWVYDLASGKPRQLSYSAVAGLNPNDLPAGTSRALQELRRANDQRLAVDALQPEARRLESGRRSAARRSHRPDGRQLWSSPRRRSPRAATSASRRTFVDRPATASPSRRRTIRTSAAAICRMRSTPRSSSSTTGYVDAKKIGITGGSYGGFMTLMAIGRTPDVWAAGVEMFGIIDWYTMLQHEDPMLQQYEKTLLGDPEKDRAKYEASSPIKYIRDDKAPLLVLQGENDIRVPKEEAEQVVEILKKEGRTVDAHYYPAEGHGFAKRENQIDALKRTVAWFDKYLKGEASGTASAGSAGN